MEQELFRREVLAARAVRSLGVVRVATPISHQLGSIAALVITTCILIWLCIGEYTRREHVTGILVPQEGLVSVTARNVGAITKIGVVEGSAVGKGDALLAISGERTSTAMGETSAGISVQLLDQQSRLKDDLADTEHLAKVQADGLRVQQRMLKHQLQQIDAQASIEQRQVDELSVLLHRFEGLESKGYISPLQIQQQRSEERNAEEQIKSLERQRYEVEQQIKNVDDQLAQLPLTEASKIDELHRQISQIDTTLAQNEAERETVLRAPVNGVVTTVLVKPGQATTSGQSLLSIIPSGSSLQAQLLVPSSAIGFVHIGTSVALHYQAFPYQKFGVQYGNVISISRSVISQEEITNLLGHQVPPQALYRVQVELKSQQIIAYGKPEPLLPGMAIEADLLLDKRKIIEWILEPLYGMRRRIGGMAHE